METTREMKTDSEKDTQSVRQTDSDLGSTGDIRRLTVLPW